MKESKLTFVMAIQISQRTYGKAVQGNCTVLNGSFPSFLLSVELCSSLEK